MRPAQMRLGILLAPEHGNAEQVVQPAAVDADHHRFRALKHRIQRQPLLDAAAPVVGAGPAIGPQATSRSGR